MELKELFKQETSFFGQNLNSKEEVINFLAEKLDKRKIIKSQPEFIQAIKDREAQDSTGVGDGIAIPHALNPTVQKSTIAFLSLKKPIEWGSFDNQPVDLIFMIATNGVDGEEHLTALASLSGYLMKPEVLAGLRQATDFAQMVKNFKPETKKAPVKKQAPKNGYEVVGITACPTGIAHTYLAEEKLIQAAEALSMSVKVETQGRRGVENRLTPDDIKNAKVVILGHDKAIEGMARFNGVKVLDTSTKEVIYKGQELIETFDQNPKVKVVKNAADNDDSVGELSLKKFKDFKGNLLGGVSRMLPFVVGGGIILGIGFLIDFIAGNGNAGGDFGTINHGAGWFSAIGKTAMMMMVPVLGGYIAYSIVGAQGLMPGFVAGLLADGTGGFAYGNVGSWSGLWTRIFKTDLPMNSGFIGAMVGGYLAALLVFGLTLGMRKFKKSFQGVRDIVFIPVLSLLGIAVAMFALNIPLGYLMYGIKEGLTWLANHNLLVLLGGIIGLMMCVDMGGPINKIAYVLGTMSVGGGLGDNPLITNIMAASMAGGMIPPLGIALCTVVFRSVWTPKERDAAKANWLMGAFFITEGAIPFMVIDPKRISVSALSGGLITGLLVGAFQITLPAPHGGICVFPLLDSHLFTGAGVAKGLGITFYILSIVAGVVAMMLILGFWKKIDLKKGKLKLAVTEESTKKTKSVKNPKISKKVTKSQNK